MCVFARTLAFGSSCARCAGVLAIMRVHECVQRAVQAFSGQPMLFTVDHQSSDGRRHQKQHPLGKRNSISVQSTERQLPRLVIFFFLFFCDSLKDGCRARTVISLLNRSFRGNRSGHRRCSADVHSSRDLVASNTCCNGILFQIIVMENECAWASRSKSNFLYRLYGFNLIPKCK